MTDAVKRADFVKRSFEVFHGYCEREPYRSRLETLQQLGYSAEIWDTVFNPDAFVPLPFESGDTVDLPFDSDSHKFGVVAIRPDECLRLNVDTHPLQGTSYSKTSRVLTFPEGAGASTINDVNVRPIGDKYEHVYGRPTLFLPYDDDRSHEYATVLAHETRHVMQQLVWPLRTYNVPDGGEDKMIDDFNNELEAYQFQEDMFGLDVDFIMDATASMACTVVSYRKRKLRADNGRVTQGTLDAIRRDEVVGRIVRNAWILE